VGAAAELRRRELKADAERVVGMRDRLERMLTSAVPGVTVNCAGSGRLPNTSHLTFDGVEAEAVLLALGDAVALSTGSACTSASVEPSHVLIAMGLRERAIFGSVRFSLGHDNTEAEVDRVAARVTAEVARLRSMRRGLT
jgi:cysteine desulfurase